MEYTLKHVAAMQIGVAGDAGCNVHVAFNYTDFTWTSTTAKRPGVNNRYLNTDPLFTVDLVASYPLSDAANVYVRVDNVFDEQRITHRGSYGARSNAPRWLSFELKYTF